MAIEGHAVLEKDIYVLIPALNEEESVAKVIEEIPKERIEGKGYRVEIIVIDNNSTDRTKQIAEQKQVKVIVEPLRGKGRAVSKAFGLVEGNFVFMLDADYTYPATCILEMLEILEGGGDVVIASRLRGQMEKGAMSRMNFVGNHLLAFLANLLYRTSISDLCTGCWGFRGAVIKELRLDAKGFEIEANMFVEVAKRGYRLAEVPINYRRRTTRPKLKSLRDGFRIGMTLIRKRLR